MPQRMLNPPNSPQQLIEENKTIMSDKVYYNHAFDIGFTVMTTNPDGKATDAEILDGLRRRIAMLEQHPDEIQEAVNCYDPSDEEYTEGDYIRWKAGLPNPFTSKNQ